MLLIQEDHGVEGLLQDGSHVGGEGHHDQLLALVECLVTHGLQGVGQDDLTDGSAREGHVGDANGTRSHVDGGSVAGVSHELQTVGHHAVEVTVNDTDGVADVEGQGLVAVLVAVEGLGLGEGEGLQAAVCEGIVAQVGQSGAQLHGEVGHGLLQECLGTHVGGRGQVCLHDGGVSQGVVAHVGGLIQVLELLQSLTVSQRALLQASAVGIQGDGGQLLVVDQGVLADGLHVGEVGVVQRGSVEGVRADGHHVCEVEVGQRGAVEEGLLGNVSHTGAQLHALDEAALCEGVTTDGGCGGQVDGLEVGGVEAVDVVTVLVVGLDGHGAVGEDAQHIAAEGKLANGQNAREIHILQRIVVVEGVITDDGTLAQGHGLQLGGTEEGGVTDGDVLSDGQLGHGRGEDVVVQGVIAHLVGGGGEVVVHVQTEGGLTNDDVVTDLDGTEGLALTEGGLADDHTVGNGDALQGRACEGVVTDDGHAREIGSGLDAGVVEGVVTDGGELAQVQRGQILEVSEGVIAHGGDLRHLHGGDLGVAREGAGADGGDLGIGQLEGALHAGSHQNEGVSFII